MTAAARLNYLTAYRLQRLGAFVLRDDYRAPLAVWAAQCAAETARTPDPLSAPLTVRRGAQALAVGLGIGRLRLRRSGHLPADLIPPAAGPAAPPPAGLPAPATVQATEPAQPDFSDDLILCDTCEGTGRLQVCSFSSTPIDEFDVCHSCGGTGYSSVPDEPAPTSAQQLARALAACVQSVDCFYHSTTAAAADLHADLKATRAQARLTLLRLGFGNLL